MKTKSVLQYTIDILKSLTVFLCSTTTFVRRTKKHGIAPQGDEDDEVDECTNGSCREFVGSR